MDIFKGGLKRHKKGWNKVFKYSEYFGGCYVIINYIVPCYAR